jgi:hypothetical protein
VIIRQSGQIKIIGVDFDNTIVCYDQVFHQVAVERRLIPAQLPTSKGMVRDYLRQCDREDAWTEMQGYVYGARMQDALPFPGVLRFFQCCRQQGVTVCIISHKTHHPYLGPKYDLHQAAQAWLENQGFYDPNRLGLSRGQVFFELTKQEKIARITRVGCSHFIDDLPEFLSEDDFPPGIERILFDPNGKYLSAHNFLRKSSWDEIEAWLI